MLSYKLKHLCSRVIASLSAVGLFSITGTGKAAAGEYNFGASYEVHLDKTFSANYQEEETINCSMVGDVDVAVSTVVSGEDGAGYLACSYVLKRGFVYYDKFGTCLDAGVSSTPDTKYYNSGVSCEVGTYSGDLYGSIKQTGIESFTYHVQTLLSEVSDIGSDQYVVTVTGDASGYAALDPSRLGYKPLKVTFDCKAGGGSYSDSANGATGYAYTYSGGSVIFPGANNCVAPDGYKFSGWKD